jgi:hypothetical protein
MKKNVVLFFLASILAGCGMYRIPLEGKLSGEAIRALQPLAPDSPRFAVFLEKGWDQRVIVKKAGGTLVLID